MPIQGCSKTINKLANICFFQMSSNIHVRKKLGQRDAEQNMAASPFSSLDADHAKGALPLIWTAGCAAAPDFDEGPDGVSQPVSPEVIPEDAGRAWMSHDVRVALMQVVLGEGPVIQGRPCIMVLYEGDSSGGPHA